MSRTILALSFALILLGFLASTTLNMYSDVEALMAENERMSEALSKLGSEYNSLQQERDLLRSQNMELLKKNEALQQAYVAENRARTRAETELTARQKGLNELMNSPQSMPQTSALDTVEESIPPEKAVFDTIIPFGTGFLALAVLAFSRALMRQARANQKLSKTVPTTRRFPRSIPRN